MFFIFFRRQFLQHPAVTSPKPQTRKWLFSLLLALVTLATFWPVVHNGFIEYDDDEYIFENPTVRAGWTAPGFAWAFMGFHCANYHPLTWLSHMTDCQFFGVNPAAHHLVNVAFHAANAVLLLWLLDGLTGKFWRSAFVATLFALHPLRVESVAWAAERKDVLCAFFFLLTLLMYVRHVQAQLAGEKRRIGTNLRLALLFYFLALLAKPMAVTLPLVLLLLDFWPLRRDSSFTFQASSLLAVKWPFFFLSATFGSLTLFAQHGTLNKETPTLATVFASATADYFEYLQKVFWPQNLSFLYERHAPVTARQLLLAALVLAGISALALFNWRRRPWLAFGWLWFVVMLLPVTMAGLNKLSIADRYTYLPSIGFSVMLVWGITETRQKMFAHPAVKILAATGAAVILVCCARQTQAQISFWKNSQTLTEHALQLDPENDVAAQILRIYRFEQAHPGVRENHAHGNPAPQTPR